MKGAAFLGVVALAALSGGAAGAEHPSRFPDAPHGPGVRLRLKMQIQEDEVTTWLYVPGAPSPSAASGAPSPGPAPAPPAPATETASTGPQAAPEPVLFYSGEWGWTQIHQETATRLAKQGRFVLGLDSTTYFLKNAEPPVLAADFETLRATLNAKAGRPKDAPVLLVGFGFGAEMIPYVLNRSALRGVQGALLMAPDDEGAKVFRVSVQLKLPSPPAEIFDVTDEIRRLAPIPVAFLDGGNDERAKGRTFFKLVRGPRKYVPIPGADHQFHEARDLYFDQVANCLRWLETQAIGPRPPEIGSPAQ